MTLLFFESYHVFHSCLPVPDLVQLTHKLGKISRLGESVLMYGHNEGQLEDQRELEIWKFL